MWDTDMDTLQAEVTTTSGSPHSEGESQTLVMRLTNTGLFQKEYFSF
jgi:hypothetical protein